MAAESSTDVDFWEFVSCAKCHLPYVSEPGKSVPFWLTDCGHVICNHHLNPDQSCVSCGSTGILVTPLQQELDAPMSEWFGSIPAAMDLIAYAAKQEAMARQIRFYRSRHQQLRAVIEKLRSENSELKRNNEMLAQQSEQFKHQFGYQDFGPDGGHEPLNVINQNGKRSMGDHVYQYDYLSNRPRTGSSPLHNSMTPARLTIPAGQRVPEFPHPKENAQHVVQVQSHHGTNQVNVRPVSRQIGRFAYIPPETPQVLTSSRSHAQMAPKLIRPSQVNQDKHSDTARTNPQGQVVQHRNTALQPSPMQQSRAGNMGPPPVPQARLGTPAVPTSSTRQFTSSNRRFVPPQNTPKPQPPPSTSHGSQRFFQRASQNSSGTSGTWSNAAASNPGGTSGAGYG